MALGIREPRVGIPAIYEVGDQRWLPEEVTSGWAIKYGWQLEMVGRES